MTRVEKQQNQPNYILRRSIFFGSVALASALTAHWAGNVLHSTEPDQPSSEETPVSRNCVPGTETFVIESGNIHEIWQQATLLNPEDVNQGVAELSEVNEWLSPSLVQPGIYTIPVCTTSNQ